MDSLTPEQRRRCMQANRPENAGLEKRVTSALRQAGMRFRRHDRRLPGTPDVVFPGRKLAVFVDGDFWHGFRYPQWRSTLNAYWREKIERNRRRDQRNFAKLRRLGWTVARVWEHQVDSDLQEVVRWIAGLAARRGKKGRTAWTRIRNA